MKKHITAITITIIAILLGASRAEAVTITEDSSPALKKTAADSSPLLNSQVFSSYRGPGDHDYRDNRLARLLQRRKRALALAGPLPPPPSLESLAVKVPVILIEYPDAPLTVTTDDIEDFMFGGDSSPNMTDYYEEVSHGQFTIDGDVYGPYRVSTDYADYSASDREAFITEAVELADGEVDYSDYDADGDGYVDAVIVVASDYIQVLGYESAHQSAISDYTTDDGAIVSEYTSQREDCSVGIYCHEFGHVLGLPDLYSGGSGQAITIGEWGLMGYGASNNPPAHFCGWSKIELGWISPIEITASVENQPIGNLEEYGHVYKLFISGIGGSEYLLVENRQPIGSDAGLPGDGLLIWHAGYHDPSDPAGSYYDNHVVLVPAGEGAPDDANSDDSDPFPGSGDVREYLDDTFGIEISDISDSGSIMYADFYLPEDCDGWTYQDSPLSNDLFTVAFADEETGWAAGEEGNIIHTDDGGTTWQEQSTPTAEDIRAMVFADSSTGWAVGDSGVILKTSNGGTTWEEQISGTGQDINSISFVDIALGWALTDDGTLLSTDDGGNTWTSALIDTDEITPVEVEFPDSNSGFIAGRERIVFCSNDGGDSWSAWEGVAEELTSDSLEILRLLARADNDIWLLGNSDRGYLIWVWEGHVTYFWLGDYMDLADFDISGDLGIAAGEKLVVMNLCSELGFGLELFSLPNSSNEHRLDEMEWADVPDWSRNLENAPLAVEAASNQVAYVVGENGLILRYDREDSCGGSEPGWTNFTFRPPPGNVSIRGEGPITRFEPVWAVENPAVYPADPATLMTDRARFYLENGGPVIDWPFPIPEAETAHTAESTLEQKRTTIDSLTSF